MSLMLHVGDGLELVPFGLRPQTLCLASPE